MTSKISLIVSILSLALAGYLFFRKPQLSNALETRTGEPVKVAEAFSTAEGVKPVVLAFVNGDTLNEHYTFIVEKRTHLESKLAAAENKVRKEYQTRQSEVERLVQYAEKNPNLPASEQAAIQNDIMRMENEMAAIQEREMSAIQKQRDELDEELHKKVGLYLENYAKQKGIDYVVNYQKEMRYVLYGNPAYDITEEVLAGLNAEYAREKEASK